MLHNKVDYFDKIDKGNLVWVFIYGDYYRTKSIRIVTVNKSFISHSYINKIGHSSWGDNFPYFSFSNDPISSIFSI